MGKISFLDKDKTATDGVKNKWRDTDANEVKAAVNWLYDNPPPASGGTAETIDYMPADSDNVNGFWAGLIPAGVLKINTALDKIRSVLNFDTSPTAASNKLLRSGAIHSALQSLDYTPADSDNASGFWAGLLGTVGRIGKTYVNVALDRLAAEVRIKKPQTLTDVATITWNLAAGYNAGFTIGGNRTLAISGAVAGDSGLLKIVIGPTPAYTLTLPANSKVTNNGDGVITLTGVAGATDILTFFYDGTDFLWTYGRQFS